MDYFQAREKVFRFIDTSDPAYALGALGSLVSTLITQANETQRNEALRTISYLQEINDMRHQHKRETELVNPDATKG